MVSRVFDRVLTSLAAVAAGIIVYMAVSVDFEVIMRYAFNRPTTWVVDFAEYALFFILFLAAAWVLSKEGHVKIDILFGLLSPRKLRVLNTITSLVGAAVCAIYFWYSVWVVCEVFAAGEILWKSIIVPKWSVWIVMPVGTFLLTVEFVRRAWLYARGGRE